MTILENAMVGQHCRSKGGVFGSIVRTMAVREEEERIRERPRGAVVLRQAAVGLPPAAAGVRPVLREPPPARDGPRDGHRSHLLLLEPTAGMNPRETLELRDHIVRMRDELGLTLIVIEHDMRVVKGVSDRVIACDYGQKIAEGTYDEVAHDERVIEAYLGTKATE